MKNATFEKNEDNVTGAICPETATYVCELHTYIQKYIVKGNQFPKCDQKGLPHNTKWYKLI